MTIMVSMQGLDLSFMQDKPTKPVKAKKEKPGQKGGRVRMLGLAELKGEKKKGKKK